MRLSLFLTAGALAASIGLSACSSGSSQAVPGAQQAAPMAKSGGPHIVVIGAKPDAACTSNFITCVTISKKAPGEVEICIQYTTGTCPYPGTWNWAGQVQTVKTGKPFKNIKSSISPNPGNPTYFTIKEGKKKVKSTKGKYKYQDEIEACNSTSQCLTGAIGIAVKGK